MGRTSDAVAEGVSIALAAARLSVRNRILVDTISAGGQFDPDAFAAIVRGTLLALADEQLRAAERARRLRRGAWGKFSTSSGTHDYRDRDTANLRRRRKQYLRVAKELRAHAADPDRVRELLESARDAAWGDVESNLQRRLQVEAQTFDADPESETMRKARMDSLRMIDLARLASQAKRKSQQAKSVDS